MFRASLRAARDPRRKYVCSSCITQRFGTPRRLFSCSIPSGSSNGSSGIATSVAGDSQEKQVKITRKKTKKPTNHEKAAPKKPPLPKSKHSITLPTEDKAALEAARRKAQSARDKERALKEKAEKEKAEKEKAEKEEAEKEKAEKEKAEKEQTKDPPKTLQDQTAAKRKATEKNKASEIQDEWKKAQDALKELDMASGISNKRLALENAQAALDRSVEGEIPAVNREESQNQGAAREGERDSESVIRDKLQSIVNELQLRSQRASTKSNRETPSGLSFLTSSMYPKSEGLISPRKGKIVALDYEKQPVPRLSFGLDRVLFNPGVYHLRDPRSRVYNFDPYLGSIMPVSEFDFEALKEYITSSKDEVLRGIAKKEAKKYIGSSSSMTSVLSHFHYLLSAWRPIDPRNVSQGFPDKLRTFTRLMRAPSAMFLRYQNGTYAIDADKEFDTANVLMNLGKSMEKLLTLPKEDFERYRRTHKNKVTYEEEQSTPESYHYSTYGDFLMRSQLDAYDPRIPGTGMFDLKTRAVVSIRMDAQNFESGLGYEIRDRFGEYQSYEREYFDMIRAAFLKYALQVRIGRMDGIFVAYHNVQRIFGFQYISLPEMDQALHGQENTVLGNTEFKMSLELWNKILDKATARFPQQSLRMHFETRDTKTPFMYIFAEPVTDEEINAIQTKNADMIDRYQRKILNLRSREEEDASTSAGKEETGENATVHEAEGPPDSQPQQTPDGSTAPRDESTPEKLDSVPEAAPENDRDILAMTLSIKNIVNGDVVERPNDLRPNDNWSLMYTFTELEGDQKWTPYNACKNRREKIIAKGGEDGDVTHNAYSRKLLQFVQKGRAFRARENELDAEQKIHVLGEEE